MTALPTFRIFFADGAQLDETAPNAAIARSQAKEKRPGVQILKTKVVREKASA